MTNNRQPANIRQPDEGRVICVVGDIYRFLATSDETGGRYAMWETIVTPGHGPPPHIHTREEETFFVLEGEMTFFIDEKPHIAGPGYFVRVPIGTLHRFENRSGKVARMIISVMPGGLEKMFFDAGQQLLPDGAAPQPSPADIERLLAEAPKYGVQILAPPH